jgi:hypothetical protein
MKHRSHQAATKFAKKTKRKGPSKYAAKLARGNMMYGPGCGANIRKGDK